MWTDFRFKYVSKFIFMSHAPYRRGAYWFWCGSHWRLWGRLCSFASVRYLLYQWMEFYQTCIDTLLGWGKGLIRFWWPWPYFQGYISTSKWQGHHSIMTANFSPFDTLSSEQVNGFWLKVSKGAKIRNRYNQVPHLTQDTNGKVTNSQWDTKNGIQEVSPFQAGDQKAHLNRRTQRHSKHKKDPQKKYRLGTVSKIFYLRA